MRRWCSLCDGTCSEINTGGSRFLKERCIVRAITKSCKGLWLHVLTCQKASFSVLVAVLFSFAHGQHFALETLQNLQVRYLVSLSLHFTTLFEEICITLNWVWTMDRGCSLLSGWRMMGRTKGNCSFGVETCLQWSFSTKLWYIILYCIYRVTKANNWYNHFKS